MDAAVTGYLLTEADERLVRVCGGLTDEHVSDNEFADRNIGGVREVLVLRKQGDRVGFRWSRLGWRPARAIAQEPRRRNKPRGVSPCERETQTGHCRVPLHSTPAPSRSLPLCREADWDSPSAHQRVMKAAGRL